MRCPIPRKRGKRRGLAGTAGGAGDAEPDALVASAVAEGDGEVAGALVNAKASCTRLLEAGVEPQSLGVVGRRRNSVLRPLASGKRGQNDYQEHESHQAQHTGYPFFPDFDRAWSPTAPGFMCLGCGSAPNSVEDAFGVRFDSKVLETGAKR